MSPSVEKLFPEVQSSQAENLYYQGIDAINAAMTPDGLDKTIFGNSLDLFLEAIQLEPSWPDPYVSVAFLFHLMEEKTRAWRYLEQALKLDPEHDEARALQTELTGGVSPPQPETVLEAENPPEDGVSELDFQVQRELDDLDEQELLAALIERSLAFDPADPQFRKMLKQIDPETLYAGLEKMLNQEVQTIMTHFALLQPSPDSDMAKELLYLSTGLFAKAKLFHFSLDMLEQACDILPLKQKLQALDAMAKRVLNLAEISDIMVLLHQRLRQGREVINKIRMLVPQTDSVEDAQYYDTALEPLIQEYTWLASDIKRLEKFGHDITPLKELYNSCVTAIEALRSAWKEPGSEVQIPIAALTDNSPHVSVPIEANQDYHALYQDIQKLLHRLLDLSLDQPHPPFTTDPKVLEAQREALQGRQQDYQTLQKKIEQLAKAEPVDEFEADLLELDAAMTTYHKGVLANAQMLSIHTGISEIRQTCGQIPLKLSQATSTEALEPFTAELNRLFDASNHLADQLDLLDGAGVSITLVEADYMLMIKEVTETQDQLDRAEIRIRQGGVSSVAQAKQRRTPSTAGLRNVINAPKLSLSFTAQILKSILIPEPPFTYPSLVRIYELLQTFSKSADRNFLNQALEISLTGLSKNKCVVDNYSLMACIAFACKKPYLALEYVDFVQAIEPEHPLIQPMVQRLKKMGPRRSRG